MAEDSGTKWKKIILISLIILFVIVVLITVFVGLSSLRTFFSWLFIVLLVIGILFGLAYVFYLIFIAKSFKDIPATYKKKLVATAKLMKNDMLGELYLSGDQKHNRIKLGKYRYLRINLPKQTVNKEDKGLTEEVPVDCFMVLKSKMMDKLFGNPIFILCKPQDHNYSDIFNDVTLTGFNLVPLDSQFFTLNHRNLDIDITRGMATNYIREVVYEIFRDLDKLVKQAMNLDQQHQKEKERSLEFEIPQLPRQE